MAGNMQGDRRESSALRTDRAAMNRNRSVPTRTVSRRLPVVVFQEAAEPHPALDRPFAWRR